MKAALNGDIILQVNVGDTEIGPIPKGVGLERLRWDGQRVVDLMSMNPIWVEHRGGVFILHAVKGLGWQSVAMNYTERKRLINDNGTFRVKTTQEIAAEEALARAVAKNSAAVRGITSDTDQGLILDVIKLLYALIVAPA